MILLDYFNDFWRLLFPNCCLVCGCSLMKGEEHLCTKCFYNLPKTNFHQNRENPVAKLFWGRVKIEYATSFIYYQKASNYRNIIYSLKYKGNKRVGEVFGTLLGNEVKKIEALLDVDWISPVPLHPKRERNRGYNQSYHIAKGIAEALQKDINTEFLVRSENTKTQTKRNKYERWENMLNKFKINKNTNLEGKHILLVDDVVTTGATIEACSQLLINEKAKVSVITLACASN